MAFVILTLFTLSSINAQVQIDETTKKRKSKEIALIKTIGGIVYATGSLYGALSGAGTVGATLYSRDEHNKDHKALKLLMIIGTAKVVLSLIVGLFSLKITKDGMEDLEEVAQEEQPYPVHAKKMGRTS